MATKKRQYRHDLIKVTTDDKRKATEAAGGIMWGFASHTSCPIATSLNRHGYKSVHVGMFSSNSNNTDGFQTLRIGRKSYKVPPKMEDWQQRGVDGKRTQPFQFRISELELIS
jgi:hypothetical protein